MAKIKSIKYIGDLPQKCIRVSSKDGLYITDNHIITHNSSKTSLITTGNGLNWKVISSAGSLLGINILVGAMTEITFFLESGKGWTPQKILQFYSKLRQRISSRFQSSYYARLILDSSPGTLEDDPIQNYMSNEAYLNPENFIWKGSRWDIYPEEFPEFCNVNNLHTLHQSHSEIHNYDVGFQLFKGNSGKLPEVCENDIQASRYDPVDLVWCPRKQITGNGVADFLGKAKENPIEFMKDFAGLPSGQPDRIFYDSDKIEDCFANKLKAIYGSIKAPAMEDPEHLIWNEIAPIFFYKVLDTWRFYYNPEVPRVLTIDQSESKDMAAIAMSHVEYDPNRRDDLTKNPVTVYITDMVIMISPKGGLVNLDAIKFFIMDLRRLGNINLRHISFDGFEAKGTRQFLDRANFNTEYLSVDRDNVPYLTWIDLVFKGRWHCGKNIFVKNNMKSLRMTKRKTSGSTKIDHFNGPLEYTWTGDWMNDPGPGTNAKDSVDCIAGNIAMLTNYAQEFIPYIPWSVEKSEGRTLESIKKGNLVLMKEMNFI